MQASVDPNAFDLDSTETVDSGTALAGTLVASLIQFAAAALAIAACFKAISAAYLGEHAGVAESLRYAVGRLLPLIVAYILVVIIVVIGLVALIIPGIWLAVKLSMVFPAVVFERTGPFAAIGRSWSLTNGSWWRIFGTLLVVFLITFVLQIVLGGVVGGLLAAADSVSELTAAIVLTLVNLLALALTYPLWASVTSVVYYDLRVRNEGFDLQLLAQGVGAEPPRFESAPERPAAAARRRRLRAAGGIRHVLVRRAATPRAAQWSPDEAAGRRRRSWTSRGSRAPTCRARSPGRSSGSATGCSRSRTGSTTSAPRSRAGRSCCGPCSPPSSCWPRARHHTTIRRRAVAIERARGGAARRRGSARARARGRPGRARRRLGARRAACASGPGCCGSTAGT